MLIKAGPSINILLWDELCLPPPQIYKFTSQFLVPQNVTEFGSKVFKWVKLK